MSRVVTLAFVTAALLVAAAGATSRAYQGTYYGRTAQGKAMSFVVSGADRVTKLTLAYSLPGCDVTQKIDTSVPIRGGAFTFSLNVPSNKLSITGRFGSSLVTGTLTASGDCGQMTTVWRAAKGAAPAPPPPAKRKPTTPPKTAAPSLDRFDGAWEGKAALPAGLDPELVDFMGAEIDLDVFDGAFEAVRFPLLIQGEGCTTGDLGDKEFTPPLKLKGAAFSLAFRQGGVKVLLTGTFDTVKRAHGTITQTGSFEGCAGTSKLTWKAANW